MKAGDKVKLSALQAEQMGNRSLGEVAAMRRDHEISDADADAYIERWNAGAWRFTRAERIGSSIVQLMKCGDCGEIRRDHTNSHRFVD